jgi:hypothetical protein
MGMLELEARRDVLCAYPLSGQYCYAPRILYYVLIVAAVLIRKHTWLATGAAAYVMTYATAASIHAVILCGLHASSTPLIEDGLITLGHANQIWIRARVLDLDTDATLAIVGVGFLMLLPLAVFSTTFQKSEAKPILAVWGILMLVGTICCLVTLYTVDTTPDGPFRQIRVCTAPKKHSTLSILGSFSQTPLRGPEWNSTIYDFFTKQSTATGDCFYPCVHSSQMLRSPSDITLIAFPEAKPGSRIYWAFKLLSAIVYSCVPLYIVGGFVLLAHKHLADRDSGDQPTIRVIKAHLVALVEKRLTFKVALEFVFWAFQAYALVFAPVVIVFFVAFAEYSLSLDPSSESIRHVGQWQPLVSVGLVLAAALLQKYNDEQTPT